jgi:phosphoribosylamine--glycine ligase
LDFSLRCIKAGHHVRLCCHPALDTGKISKVGDGLVEKIHHNEWAKSMNWADIVLTSDNNKWMREVDVYRKRGFPIWGASFESAELELQRGKGQALLQKAGTDVIPYEVFSDFKKAEQYVLAEKKRLVSKPTGDADKALSYVSKSTADMLFMLRRWDELNKLKAPFLMQEFIPGVEMAVGGWLGRKGFSKWVCENFEHKKFMNDDKGPNTGEMGTVMRYTKDSELARQVLLPMERDLIRLGHTGAIDVAVIVDKDGSPRPLEFTARPSWPGFNIMQNLHGDDPVEWMLALLDGEDSFAPSEDIAVGVVVAIPPFPSENVDLKDVSGIPLYGLNDDNPLRSYINPCDVMGGSAPDDKGVEQRTMVSTGCYLMVASGCGDTVCAAAEEAYKAVESVEIPCSPQYRTDIGCRLEKDLDVLHSQGFALDWCYE